MKKTMNKFDRFLRTVNSILGILSTGIFAYALVILIRLQPIMLVYNPISNLQENLLTGVGLGLALILGFFLLSLLQIARVVRDAERLRVFPLTLIILGVICVLFVFSDYALLGDIHNQYQLGLEQPEWSLVFPIMGLQFLYTIVLSYLHVSGYFFTMSRKQVARDINIFLTVQVVGLICGLMGLGLTSLGFFFPRAWSLPVHTIMGSLTLIFPYVLAVLYWGVHKFREKDRAWWDEKQTQDVGRSAMLTLALDTVLMLTLFTANIQNLGGVVRLLWLPLFIFGTITFLSMGNLYFSSRA
jgi:hypothetical protein